MIAKLVEVIRSKNAATALSLSRIGRPSDGSSRFHRHSVGEEQNTKGSVPQAVPEAR